MHSIYLSPITWKKDSILYIIKNANNVKRNKFYKKNPIQEVISDNNYEQKQNIIQISYLNSEATKMH